MSETSVAQTLGQVLPHVNAVLNTCCALLLYAGRVAIRKQKRELHKQLMIRAFAVSVLFLLSYLTRFALTGTHPYPGHGFAKAVYLVILFSHMLGAAMTPVLAIRALWLGLKARLPEHRRVVRYAYPIWMYVSVTGVIVYVMLYHG